MAKEKDLDQILFLCRTKNRGIFMSSILNGITQSYHQAVSGWHHYLFPITQHLFGTLAVIEIAWSGILWVLCKQEVESLWVEFLKKMITLGFFYTLLVCS